MSAGLRDERSVPIAPWLAMNNRELVMEGLHMHARRLLSCFVVIGLAGAAAAAPAWAQAATDDSRFVVDLGVGLDLSVNGNVNSGAIGRLQGQAAAILPQPYGEVY